MSFIRHCAHGVLGLACLAALGCGPTITHDVKPIHITVSIKLVDQELDDLFAFEDELSPSTAPKAK
ncbi:MAG: hypothetical protein ACYTGH_09820 [Planctomycetota bacterium]|jgi:hypothetical protein